MEKMKILVLVLALAVCTVWIAGCRKSEDDEERGQESNPEMQDIVKTTQENELTEKENNSIIIMSSVEEDEKKTDNANNVGIEDEKSIIHTGKVNGAIYAYVDIPKEELKGMSQEDFKAFAEEWIKGQPYNWFTIRCGDGTGIQFAGCNYTVAVYGVLNECGQIDEEQAYIWLSDGAYQHEMAE